MIPFSEFAESRPPGCDNGLNAVWCGCSGLLKTSRSLAGSARFSQFGRRIGRRLRSCGSAPQTSAHSPTVPAIPRPRLAAVTSYISSVDGIRPEQLAGGFFVGWPVTPSPQRHLEPLRGSYAVELALDGDKVIGFATAISDGVISAYIPLLEVLPDYQAHGIGSALIDRLVDRLEGLYMIDLSCDAGLEAFYARLGFSPLDRAMGQRRLDALRQDISEHWRS